MNRLAVIGAGSWGTALALVLAPRFERVMLWVYEPDLASQMQQTRENAIYLPGFQLPANVEVTEVLRSAVEGADLVLSAVPSHVLRGIYEQIAEFVQESMAFVSATKGLENATLLRPSEIIQQVLGPRFQPRIAVLSGPTFARDVANLNPTALVIASTDRMLVDCVQTAFSGPTFRLYTSPDAIGVEIGGAVKNVVAIGAGVVHGLGLGHNAMAALITRGLAEITRLATALGGREQTLSGLAGLGDLVLTCTGELSRNRTVGLELAKGRRLGDIVSSMRMVAEGIKTTTATVELARRHSVEMPITEQMHQMLYGGLSPREAVRKLMERTLRSE